MTGPLSQPVALLLLLALQATAGRVLQDEAGSAGPITLPARSRDVSADIFRGSVAPPGVFDWMVDMKTYMQDSTTGQVFVQHRCGGALIAPDAVLTGVGEGPAVGQLEGRQRCQPGSVQSGGAPHLASRFAAPAGVDASANNQKPAHCVVMEDGSTLPMDAVVLEIGGQQYAPSALHVHSGYDHAALTRQNVDYSDGVVNNPPQPMHDLAVWRLASAVPDAELIQLPSADLQLPPGTPLEVAGWGRTGSDESLPSSDTLLYAQLQLAAPFDWDYQGAAGTCPMPSFTDTLCAVNVMTGANACAGDSGGPLILRDYFTGSAQVVGIVSHGPPCDRSAYGIYTDVRSYLNDIAEWMA